MCYKNKLYNPMQMNVWMGIDFLSLRDKGSCLYILSNGPMFIKKEIHDAMLRIMMKWPRT
jgi:hypothetical protein